MMVRFLCFIYALGVFSQTCNQFGGQCQSGWMQNLPDSMKQVSIDQLKLPGSHDSAAYQLNLLGTPGMEKTPSLDWIKEFALLDSTLFHLLMVMTITQSLNLYQQLEQGIRALDLRILYNRAEDQFYLSHSFATVNFAEGLSQIKAFLDAHPAELIIITLTNDSEHGHATIPMLDRVVSLIQSILGVYLIPATTDARIANDMTLAKLVSKNQRILLTIDAALTQSYESVWPVGIVETYWPNQVNSQKSLNAIQNYLAGNQNFPKGILNGVFFTVTPDQNTALEGAFGELFNCGFEMTLFDEATKINQLSASYIQTSQTQIQNLSIFWVDNPTDAYVQQIIDLND